jgi:hypothetical protein
MSSPITTAVAAPAAAPIAGPLSEPWGVWPGLVSVGCPAFVDGRCDAGTVVGWERVGAFCGEVGFESELVLGCRGCVEPTVGSEPVGFWVCVAPEVDCEPVPFCCGGSKADREDGVLLCGTTGVGRGLTAGCDGDFLLTGVDGESLFGGVSFCEERVCACPESARKASVASPAMRILRLADFADE